MLANLSKVDGALLKKMIIAGTNTLNQNRDIIDALNVFPVPDGDTGINMSMTTLAAAKEVESVNSDNIHEVAKAASNGSLRGARGNSGVILSQLFRGFAKGFEYCSSATTEDLAHALHMAAETAYKAVMKPKEGTILTVAKGMAIKAMAVALDTDDVVVFMGEVLKAGNEILAKTTEMLPALKQANVVDAGGQGLLCILEGAYSVISESDAGASFTVTAKLPDQDKIDYTVLSKIHDEDIEFTYCTEFFIDLKDGAEADEKLEMELKSWLDTVGDSIVVVCDNQMIKVHVHTNNPGNVLEKAITIGSISNIKIENMRIQHTEKISFINGNSPTLPQKEWKKSGFVVVSAGDGIRALFENLGADKVVEGGQTMNPSTEDIIQAIESIDAHTVYVFPNNKNIVLAAQQAALLLENKKDKKEEKEKKEKNIIVIPTKSIPQGITALVGYSELASEEENAKIMTGLIEHVHCGMVTYAVRDSSFNDNEIKEGDILCMYDGDIALVSNSVIQAGKDLIDYMASHGGEVMTIYYGAEISEDEAMELQEYATEKHEHIEIELQNGGQPLYYYIISIE